MCSREVTTGRADQARSRGRPCTYSASPRVGPGDGMKQITVHPVGGALHNAVARLWVHEFEITNVWLRFFWASAIASFSPSRSPI